MPSVYKIATYKEIFTPISSNINRIYLENTVPTTFTEKIKYIRIGKNLTQLQFAKLLHRGFTTITKWEQRLTYPKEETLIEICKTLNVDPKYF